MPACPDRPRLRWLSRAAVGFTSAPADYDPVPICPGLRGFPAPKPTPCRRRAHLAVLAEVRPHTGAVAAAHEDVVGEKVGAGNVARKLAAGRVVVVA